MNGPFKGFFFTQLQTFAAAAERSFPKKVLVLLLQAGEGKRALAEPLSEAAGGGSFVQPALAGDLPASRRFPGEPLGSAEDSREVDSRLRRFRIDFPNGIRCRSVFFFKPLLLLTLVFNGTFFHYDIFEVKIKRTDN